MSVQYYRAILWTLFVIVKLVDVLPVEPNFDFVDHWNYRLPVHDEPLLNGSAKYFLMPIYSFVDDLKIDAFNASTTNKSQTIVVPSSRESKIVGDIIRSKVSCNVCVLGVGLLNAEVKKGTSFEELKAKFVQICVTFKIETFSVCSGLFDVYGPEVVPVLDAITLGPGEICKLVFGETCLGPDVETHEWIVELPPAGADGPVVQPPLPQIGGPVFKVLQLSDTHYDLDYSEGSAANCDEPLCCREYSTQRGGEDRVPAGRWGSYEKCDAPKALLQNMLEHIALQHPDIDYILWTGDLPPHDIWNQTKNFNLNTIGKTIDMVTQAFPNIPIFPAIGNHEASPSGNFAPPWMDDPSHSPAWLYKEIERTWSRWLPESAKETVFHGAFYSVLLRPGFRLISVNTNYCHSLSWWLLLNSTDPANELKWLVRELQEAENKGEIVHIIGHIAPGSSDCMKTWSRNFYSIVNRYEGTIKGLFYGHSHADEFQMFYSTPPEASRPTAVAYLAPSLTTFTHFNPAYRIYYVDGDHENTTREVIEHETWTFDLDKANAGDNKPEWYKLYSAKDAYQMDSLRPEEWEKLIQAMAKDDHVFWEFYRNYYRNSPEAPPCDKKCRVQILCDLKSGKSHSRRELCKEFAV